MKPFSQSFGPAGDRSLDRLLRAAVPVSDGAPEMPYGFDTRVVALWRAQGNGEPNGITRLIRSVAVIAAVVLITSAAGAYQELVRSELSSEPLTNEFAIADSAIADEVSP
ncbi:MAG TPA: hypothetical protein VE758_05795 [Chthoniobacterales bacterium]|nr:hypothetical protein [Chthoniobacterales bacterium]